MIDGLILRISDFLYTPWVPLFLVAAGLTFTICTGFVQFRMVREAFRVVREKPRTEGAVSSFGALMLSTASRVGTGNIAGVSAGHLSGRCGCRVLDVVHRSVRRSLCLCGVHPGPNLQA